MADLTTRNVDVVALLRRIADDRNLEVALRRFVRQQALSGDDLAKIRNSVLCLTQTELGVEWNISRTQVSRMERQPEPDRKTCDAYIGRMLRSLLGLDVHLGSRG